MEKFTHMKILASMNMKDNHGPENRICSFVVYTSTHPMKIFIDFPCFCIFLSNLLSMHALLLCISMHCIVRYVKSSSEKSMVVHLKSLNVSRSFLCVLKHLQTLIVVYVNASGMPFTVGKRYQILHFISSSFLSSRLITESKIMSDLSVI